MAGAEELTAGVTEAAAAAGVIDRYRPLEGSVQAAEFARELVAAAGPKSPARAKALLFAASRLACFAERVGLCLDEALLSEAVIERLVLVGCGDLAPASVRTLRTNLRALARSIERYPEPQPAPLPRERAKRPYSPARRRTNGANGIRTRDLLLAKSQRPDSAVGQMPIFAGNARFTLKL
jgi:hypothetical protein